MSDFKKVSLDKAVSSANIATLLDEDHVKKIGIDCKRGFDDDKTSRAQWEQWNAEALKLALQVKEAKTFPWPNSANVKFPLLTIAALSWHSKAYPATISGDSVVKYKVIGKDPDGIKADRADRKGKYMSYKLLETTTWEEQTDKGLLIEAILGTVFKKTIRDNNEKKNCSDLVMPQDLVVDYFTTDMESATRVSHMFTLSKNLVREYVLQDLFLDVLTRPSPQPIGPLEAAKDKAQHTQPNQDPSVYMMVEQACWLDLDQDGYAEPYAVTFERETGKVTRIIARFYKSDIKTVENGPNRGKIYKIIPENYYTKYELIPSPDGGFYGLGFGILLGPINESINSALNQIFDAGTMATLGGGFLGRGARIKGGEATFKPFEWKTVDSTGDNLRNNIVPLQVRDASPVLLELIKFLVGYGERVAGAGDLQMGELPGQNVKAGTAEIANENGRQIFDATYKRFWRALKEEFRKLDKLERIFIQDGSFSIDGKYYEVTKEDFAEGSEGVCPQADPNITSKTEKRMVADMVIADALNLPGFNMYVAIKRKYEAYGYSGFDELVKNPGPDGFPPPPNVKMEELKIKAMVAQTKQAESDQSFQIAQGEIMLKAQEMQANIQLMQAQAMKFQAEILEMSDNSSHEEVYKHVALLNAQIGAEKLAHEKLVNIAELMVQHKKLKIEEKKLEQPAGQ
jgi:chaperonin GroES